MHRTYNPVKRVTSRSEGSNPSGPASMLACNYESGKKKFDESSPVRTPSERMSELKSWLEGKTHVYIDYANVRAKCEKKNWQLDFAKLNQLFKTLEIQSATIYFGKKVG